MSAIGNGLLLTREVLAQLAVAEITYNRLKPRGTVAQGGLRKLDYRKLYGLLTHLGGTFNTSGGYFEFIGIASLAELRQLLAPFMVVANDEKTEPALKYEELEQIANELSVTGKSLYVFDAGAFCGSLYLCGRHAGVMRFSETRPHLQKMIELLYRAYCWPLSLQEFCQSDDERIIEIVLGRYSSVNDAGLLQAFKLLQPGGKMGLIVKSRQVPEKLYAGLIDMGNARHIEIKPLGEGRQFSFVVITKDEREADRE